MSGVIKDSECDFKRSEHLYFFIQNLAGVITNEINRDIHLTYTLF